ncbi:High-affinity branched-chain amino acid transport ATP-binding protein BraG [Hyphomicrobiales bacterium]|nr:High-affinity branched-chain amino acid transport ATP-binding protein BraG [Hyphomicrobiales bacterium]CAH1692296.1 High-affinity branched-chain amino acid transport ATP-binding protein BraG [Hyphomicrobiales bacterium]
MSTPILEVTGLNAAYGQAQILFGLNLTVHPNEIVAVMGRNGAGKSTTFKAIMGHLRHRSGSVKLCGESIEALPVYQIARRGLGFVPEDRRIFSELTVRENLDIGRQPPRKGAAQWTVEELFETFPNLAAMPDRPGSDMSGGEQQMLTIARTLMGNPYLVLLDEPSEGVAPVIVEKLARLILDLKAKGLTILLSEQNLAFAAALADRAYVLDRGQIVFEGTMAELSANEAICRTYLTM